MANTETGCVSTTPSGVAESEVSHFKHVRGGYLSDVHRKVRALEETLGKENAVEELEARMEGYYVAFRRFMDAHEKYLEAETDQAKRSESASSYELQKDRKLNLQVAYTKYKESWGGTRTKCGKGSVSRHSGTNRSSRSSRTVSSGTRERKRLAAARLKVEALAEKHELEQRLLMEEQARETREKDLRRKLEMLEVTTEMKIAEAEVRIEEEGEVVDDATVLRDDFVSETVGKICSSNNVPGEYKVLSNIENQAPPLSVYSCGNLKSSDADGFGVIAPHISSSPPYETQPQFPTIVSSDYPTPIMSTTESLLNPRSPLFRPGVHYHSDRPMTSTVGLPSTQFPTSTQLPDISHNSNPIRGLASPLPVWGNMGVEDGRKHTDKQIVKSSDFVATPQDPLKIIADAIRQGPSLPKVELFVFNGDSKDFVEFVINFRSNIEAQIDNPSQRLTRLLSQCSGKAREAIKGCVNLPADEGYHRAWEILYENFGQPHMVADAQLGVLRDIRVRQADATSMMAFSRQLENAWCTLSSLGNVYSARLDSEETLKLLMRKLPNDGLKRRWAEHAGSLILDKGQASFIDFAKFVKRTGSLLNNTFGEELRVVINKDGHKGKQDQNRVTTLAIQNDDTRGKQSSKAVNKYPPCPKCNGSHGIWRCSEFKGASHDSRLDMVKELRLCLSCLCQGHFLKSCTMNFHCKVDGCKSKHHTLLHPQERGSRSREIKPSPSAQSSGFKASQSNYPVGENQNTDSEQGSKISFGVLRASRPRICFKVVPVKVCGAEGGKEITTYAFLDSGSDATLCLKGMVEKLGLNPPPVTYNMATVNKTVSVEGNELDLRLKSLDNKFQFNCRKVLTTDYLPVAPSHFAKRSDAQNWPHLSDIDFCEVKDGDVTILIGMDHPEIIEEHLDIRKGSQGEPIGIKTPFGWTVSGPIHGDSHCHNLSVNSIRTEHEQEISHQLQKLYNSQFEDIVSDTDLGLSLEDKRAQKIMEDSTKLVDGHYQIKLPFREDLPVLPNSRMVAEKRLMYLKNRFDKDPVFKEKYTSVMSKYQEEGAAKMVSESEVRALRPVWYLPHHAVWHPKKPGEPRVVFDCAAKSSGMSLNDALLKGPDNTSTLLGVLLRFRVHNVAVAGDIKRMFHQVFVAPEDRGALSYLWWPDGDTSKAPQPHQMLVHLFGSKSSPSVCGYALRRVAEDNKDRYSKTAIDTVWNSFYVDDCLRSFSTAEEATKVIEEVCDLLNHGGFKLTKWVSNNRKVLDHIAPEEKAPGIRDLDLIKDKLPREKTLGVAWDIERDELLLTVKDKEYPNTRRGVLSSIASIYDPLGFASPLILPGRELNQSLCKSNLSWDDPLPETLAVSWQEWVEGLKNLKGYGIPRCLKPGNFGFVKRVELHHFSDASLEHGYGICSYLRFTSESNEVHCSFLYGKARVKPLRSGITVPKLELTAATVLISVNEIIVKELSGAINIDEILFWTDSTIVLRYLRNEERRFTQFVSNRVAKIREGSNLEQWHHVPSEENPADLASRGIKANEERKLKFWMNGPSFLWQGKEAWPKSPIELSQPLSAEEEGVKREKLTVATVSVEETFWGMLLRRYSSWREFTRAVAWVVRAKCAFLRKLRKSKDGDADQLTGGILTVNELETSEKIIIRHLQAEVFSTETLSKKGMMKGQLGKLKPMVEDGIIRVGGRLNHSQLEFDVMHPMIIPSDHHVTKLIILHFHKLCSHMGTQQTLAQVRQRFWIISGVSSVRRVVRGCHFCRRQNARAGEQVMAPLPSIRVTSDAHNLIYPFAAVGIDMFGPLYTSKTRVTRRSKKPALQKRYGCIFTCLRYRAVHLELVDDMSTESFIDAVTRFVARRGPVRVVFTDNGTNFHGAEKDVVSMMKAWDHERIASKFSNYYIKWNFNPPAASHQGGVWERLIRSVRRVLCALVGNDLVDDETLRTFLCEVEKVLNDRPITKLPEGPNEFEALTPNHLLLLRQNASNAPRDFQEEERFTARWKYVHLLANKFWTRWVREYLPTLQERQKWLKKSRNFRIGDMVLIIEKGTPRGRWVTGIVEETYPDFDNVVRRVKVRTSRGTYERDIRKLCMLEEELVKSCEEESLTK